jgi:AcrR family transcriptional regulator
MPRTKEANEQLRTAQREKILEAARKVFAQKGLAATMEDVAVEAGVSHGLAYRYFSGKEVIIHALVEQALQGPAADLQRFLEQPGTPGERLKLLLTAFVRSRQQPVIFQLLDQVLISSTAPDGLRDLVHRRSEVLQGVLRQLIVEGQATGEVVAGDPDQLVRAVLACLDGLIHWATYYPEQYHEHFPDAAIFLRMLKP